MAINDASSTSGGSRIAWVEPEMIELNVTETQRRPRFGRDGSTFADCQRS